MMATQDDHSEESASEVGTSGAYDLSHTGLDLDTSAGKPTKEEELKFAQKEDKWVWYLRLLTASVLIAVAIAVCIAVYQEGRESEQKNFEREFLSLGEKLVTSFESALAQRIGIVHDFAITLTSWVQHDSNISWPLVTPPDYEQRAGNTADLCKLMYITLMPMVTHGTQLDEWNAYVANNHQWRQESLAVQLDQHPEDITVKPIWPELTDIAVSPPAPVQDTGVHFPSWCSAPFGNDTSANADVYTPWNRRFFDEVLKTKELAFTDWIDFTDWPKEEKESNFMYEILSNRKKVQYMDDPFSRGFYPVMNTLDRDSSKEVVAILLLGIYWRAYFEELLPPGANGIHVVLTHTCNSNQTFTYVVNGAESEPLGKGDLHDPQYDYLGLSTNVDAVLDLTESRGGASCIYSLSVYPSEEFEESFYTNHPMIVAIILASLFLFTSAIFLLYDVAVEKRQKTLLKAAQQSGQLVQTLYPKETLEKLYQEQEDAKAKEKEAFNFRPNTALNPDSPEQARPKEAIASLYPETTIFFADLAGFTKWSSTRTPADVFRLLETLYGGFDEIARRRKVFKVETIGDCYVAATGLPEPQEEHAVIMCKFANDCILKMTQMTAGLAQELGEDTSELAMRVGLHSGPVTAGVLRGEKGRFQLFGDTVNTASRMESNGVRGRIHVSQDTADALIAKNRSSWLIEREDKIEAKGKGLMTTYFVNVGGRAKSAVSTVSSITYTEATPSTLEPNLGSSLTQIEL